MKKMKNLKMFAIAVMAFAVMAMGVHAARSTYLGLSCEEDTVSDECTLTTTRGNLAGTVAANKKVTIIGDGETINLGNLILDKNSTLEIKGAYVVLGAYKVTVKTGATLTITEAPKESSSSTKIPALRINNANAEIDVNGGTLNVIGNKSYSAIVVDIGGAGSKIKLDDATFNLNDNRGNGMQGANSLDLTAKDSTINVKNNTSNGLGANLVLENSTINASGNGYAGIIFGKASSADEDSHINAKGNVTANDDIAKQKADVLLDNGDASSNAEVATLNIEGFMDVGSIAPTRVTWTASNTGSVSTGKLVVTGNNVKIEKTVAMCKITGAYECDAANSNTLTIAAAQGEYAVVTIGDENRLYSTDDTLEITLDKAYDKLVIGADTDMKKLTVVSGTTIINEKGEELIVYEAGADRPIVVPAAEAGKDPVAVTVGTKAPEEGTPGEGQTGTEGEGSGNQGPTDNVQNPNTNDNILVYAGLGLISLATVTFTTRKRED